jgi:hypothetical protein
MSEHSDRKIRGSVTGLLTLTLSLTSFVSLGSGMDIKPGETIGPHNWQKVQTLIGQNLLSRIKQGYTFKIKEASRPELLADYVEVTEKYAGRVKLAPSGELLNYVAGQPFPNFDRSDSQAGLMLAWNFYWRWLGDDYKNGGSTREGKIIRDAIEADGSERRGTVVAHSIFTRSRVTIGPKPVIPGYEHVDWMQLRADEYPRDTSGTTTLEIRYADPHREDDLYIYVPSLRRVRRASLLQRCATIAPSEFNFDDINSFNGKITNFSYKFLGEKKTLANFSQERLPFHRKRGDYLPLDESWEVQDAYVLEITPKDPNYCYPKKIVYIHKTLFEPLWVMIWDKMGNYWKESFVFRTPVKLLDGREVSSIATVTIVNVQNGRSTVLTAARAFNQGYQPSLFTLATLQTVMRGGTIR